MAEPIRSGPVLLLSSASTLSALDARLRSRGVGILRVETVVPRAVALAPLVRRLRTFGPFDTLALSSKAAVEAFVVPLGRRGMIAGSTVEYWAAGPESARVLRRAGLRRVRIPPGEGADALRRALAGTRRTIVTPRSDRAGPEFARGLRADGHRVLDLIAYRVGPGPVLSPAERRAARSATVVVATSPSAISHFRRMVDRATFDRLRSSAQWVVLGPRTAAAARGHGLRRVAVAPSASVQRFTPYLLGVMAHATE